MKLNNIFKNAPDIEIEQLSTDSRLPMINAMFFCLNGIKYDGHNYIDEAIKNGAKVIVYSKEIAIKNNAIFIKVKNVNEALYKIAEVFYYYPNKGINKYLISGCYGRSSVSRIIDYYLNKVSTCGSVGIFGINYKDSHLDTTFPALTPLENLKVLDNFKKNNIKNAVFETSVISLYYKKLDVIKPNVFIYTNTSKYCSDYKVCNNLYFENLRKYLYTLEDDTLVLLNSDDESLNEINDCVSSYLTYGRNEKSNYRIDNILINSKGSTFDLYYLNNKYSINTKLLGMGNVYNITAAIAGLNMLGNSIEEVIKILESIDYVDGVMERINDEFNVIVDCGYEVDSILSTLEFANSTCKGRKIGIIGINYSDSSQQVKNTIELCEKYLDTIILTEDESLQGEVMDILSKTDKYSKTNKILHISFRSVAIENAINIMNRNDILLILGKGNEKYLTMGFGKEKYLGDKHYALKYISQRKENEYETI